MNKFMELQILTNVADAGGISKAADRLGIAKSAVSRRLSELEQRLGIQLFHRTTRSMKLTELGHSFYLQATRILSDLEEAEESVSQSHGDLSGTIKIAAPLSFGLLHLGPALIDFQQQHPNIMFDIDFNDRQIDLVHEGFDLGIRIAKLQDSSLIARKIAKARLVICASPSYLKKKGEPKTPEELIDHDCLVYSLLNVSNSWVFNNSKGKNYQIKMNPVLIANNGDFLKTVAIAGMGIILEPLFIAHDAIQKKQLIPILQDYSKLSTDIWAITSHTRHLSHRVRSFINFLISRFKDSAHI